VEEVLSEVLFTKRSDAEDEAIRVNGRIDPVRDPEGNITGFKVIQAGVELTLSEKLRGAAQVSPTPEGGTDASLRARLGDNIELAKGKRSGQDDIDYEQIIARIPEEYQQALGIGSGSLSYQQGHGDQDFESKELSGQYSLPIGEATVGVHGGVREEERNIVPEEVQSFFQNLMREQSTRNVGASVRGPIGKGVGSLNVNRMWGDTASPQSIFQDTRPTSDSQPITRVGAQYRTPIGPGEAVFSGDYMQRRGDRPHWQVGAKYGVTF